MKSLFALICLTAITSFAQVAPETAATYSWINANIIKAKCLMCHKGYKTYEGVMAHVVAGLPQDSKLYIRTKDGSMPRSGALSNDELDAIQNWIASGAANN